MENILDLYKNPLNKGQLDDASVTHHSYNPLCGDDVTVDLLIDYPSDPSALRASPLKKGENCAAIITDVKFRGEGCAISIAAVSLVTDEVKGKTLDEVMSMDKEQITEMLGVDVGPVRLKCALIGLQAVKLAIMDWRGGEKSGEDIVEEPGV